ncbi:flagellar brake protein [Halobacillus mangrovi]|nr:flagellar brake domain-containing protein [Halobacillus mangrovi]
MKIGMVITLEIQNEAEERTEKYRCKLLDCNPNFICIDYPVNVRTGKTGVILEGAKFQASFVSENESVYIFNTEVIGREKTNTNIPIIVLHFPGEKDLMRVQRRSYVRVNSSLDAVIKDEKQLFNTITQDISGGGVAIIEPPNSSFSEQQAVELILVLPLNNQSSIRVHTSARIIRITEQEQGYPNRLSAEFQSITEKHRQIIMKHCFDQQRQIRKLGLK